MTVTVRRKGETETLARANAQHMDKAVEQPKPHQGIFGSLES